MIAQNMNQTVRHVGSLIGILVALTTQNLVIFREHYLADVGFPWDFPLAYYAVVAHWTSAVSKGILPEWIPFQQMGYPFAFHAQSGLYYPPLWIFPILKIPYTLNAAVVFQCLHVLVGAYGMFMFLRIKLVSKPFALIGALLFQFFGGFYSNAEHVDIIRAFALTPWLLYLFSFSLRDSSLVPRRLLFIPWGLFLFITGAYPGNVISTLFILAVYILCQLLADYGRTRNIRRVIQASIALLVLTTLGIALAAIQIGPLLFYRDQFVRLDNLNLVRYSLELHHLPGLFLSNRTLPGEISMTSTYVTLPALILASFIPLARLKQQWIEATVGSVATLMAAGPQSPFWILATTWTPWLKLSRHSSSDYRIFLAITIILFAIYGLQSLFKQELSAHGMIRRTIMVAAWFGAGIYIAYKDVGIPVISAWGIATATLILVLVVWAIQPKRTNWVLLALVFIIALDAWRVLPDIPTWQEPMISSYYQRQGWLPRTDGQLDISKIFDTLPSSRPAREVPTNNFSWRGYLTGAYLTTDLSASVLRTTRVIEANPLYFEWMLLKWTPIFLGAGFFDREMDRLYISEAELSAHLNIGRQNEPAVTQIDYGINHVTYWVSLPEPMLMIENETYYPGWSGEIISPDPNLTQLTLRAIAVNDVLRAWWLPAGKYRLDTHFQLPTTPVFRIVSLGAFGIWIVILLSRRN